MDVDVELVVNRLAQLEHEVHSLRGQVAALSGRETTGQGEVEAAPSDAPPARDGNSSNRWTRRALLLGGAATVASGTAAVAGATPAAADVGTMRYGVFNYAYTDTTGLYGTGNSTLQVLNFGSQPGVAVYADSNVGAPLQLASGRGSLEQTPTTGTWQAGSFMVLSGALWYCVGGGTPGQWRLIASGQSAGAFVPIIPARVYDSRYNSSIDTGPGALSAGASRRFSVANSYTPSTNTVAIPNVVPNGARAVAINLTVTGTSGPGFLFVAPGTASTITASSINWSAAGQTIANGLIVPVDGNRELRAFLNISGGSGNSQFLVDVSGYFLGN